MFQFGLAEVAEALAVKLSQRGIDLLEHAAGLGRQIDIDHPAIFFASGAGDEAVLFEPVEEARHRRHDLNHAAADFQALHRAAFPAEDAEHVVLRTGQAKFTEEFSEAILKLVAGANDVEHRLFFGRFKRFLLAEFLGE